MPMRPPRCAEYIDIGRAEGRWNWPCEAPPGLAERVGKPLCRAAHFLGHPAAASSGERGGLRPGAGRDARRHFEQALTIANGTAYKLTGGVFSRKPAHLEAARQEFRVGNLYLNRGITGALVGRQPFGGFGLSGSGTKAGGAITCCNFVDPRAWTENTLRHGFAPGVE